MIWKKNWREAIWNELDHPWDVIVIGGGITGAGILRECCRAGLRCLLVERHDFASGTSSRSTKMVHGGLRYLKNAQLIVTYESVWERQRLLEEGKGLIKRMGFLFPTLSSDPSPSWLFGLGLTIYDLMAHQWAHQSYNADDMRDLCPLLTTPALRGGFRYIDAQVDDARLVLRIIREAVRDGGTAINYTCAQRLLRTQNGKVCGVVLQDTSGIGAQRTKEVQAGIVINATGAWADELRLELKKTRRIRPLRGSHLIFPVHRLGLQRARSWSHPDDGRPLIAMPWEGVTLVGTTDIDHRENLVTDPQISLQETEYLLKGINFIFPEQEISAADIQATFSGIRPVINTGKIDPSKESREYLIWDENGLITVSGGKLTTFRLMARDTLKTARHYLPWHQTFDAHKPVLDPQPDAFEYLLSAEHIKSSVRHRILGRYGMDSPYLISIAEKDEWASIDDTEYFWAELRWAARAEGIVHLDDLLLRRARLGLLLPEGAINIIENIRQIIQSELDWDDTRWHEEVVSYKKLWMSSYNIPG